jgi:hypothetical protein
MAQEVHPFLARLAEHGAWTPPERPPAVRSGGGHPLSLPAAGDPQAGHYAATALGREADIVASTPEGSRNHTLNVGAYRMGQLVGNGWLSEQSAADVLIDAGMAAGLSYAEAERTVTSGIRAGQHEPRMGIDLHTPVGDAYTVDTTALGGATVPTGSHDVVPDEGSTETGEPTTPQRPRQLIDGGTFIYQAADHVTAVWGEDDDVLWAEGEPLIITGPTGIGKTTLGTCVVAGRLGLLPDTLGYLVTPGRRRTLVLAMDRPRQIQRAMARLLRQYPEDVLNRRLIVWQGPPPMDLARHPLMLHQLAELADADTVVLDSLKDAALKLSEEETGQGLSRAMNYCVSNGVEVLAYHHQTKRSGNAQGKPNSLADVYGSQWITAGAGSVLLLWGNAGDLVVELSHLKQPAADVGPLQVGHDHVAGRSFLYEGSGNRDSLLDLLRSGPQTASTVASWIYGDACDRAAVAKARRRLDKLVELGQAARLDDGPTRGGTAGGSQGTRYVTASSRDSRRTLDARNGVSMHEKIGHPQVSADARGFEFSTHDSRRTLDARDARNSTNPQVSADARSTHASRGASMHATPPPFRGGDAGQGCAPTANLIPLDLNDVESNDVEVCARCLQPANRFVPAPDGKRWCPRCADPT